MLRAGGVFGLCLGVGVLTWGLYLWREAQVSEDWPTTDGKIQSSEVESYLARHSNGRVTTQYRPKVLHTYWIDGETYTGDGVSAFDSGGDSDYAQGVVTRYPAGANVLVYYDPHDPRSALLEPGMFAEFQVMMGASLFLVIGSLLLLAMDRRIRFWEEAK